jgi:hypothetical protein
MPVRSFTEDVPMTSAQNLLYSSHRVSRLGFLNIASPKRAASRRKDEEHPRSGGVALTGG